MSNLSATANAFAVVGLTDVVSRAAIQLLDLLLRAKAASKNALRLSKALENLGSVVAKVRMFANEFEQSTFALDDHRTLPQELETTLGMCLHEIGQLRLVITAATVGTKDTLLKQWRRSLGLALEEQRILRSCQILEGHKTTLTAVLMVHNA